MQNFFCQWIPVKDGNEEQIQKESCYTAITKKNLHQVFFYIFVLIDVQKKLIQILH